MTTESEVDIILGVCATYATPVLGTRNQEPFIEGFKHSSTYAEAKAAIEALIPPKSVVYCDPPYIGTTKYKDSINYDEFWAWCDGLVEVGHRVFVSEYNAPKDWQCIWSRQTSSSLTKNTGAKKGIEKLFTKNTPQQEGKE
jgi:site-specific DNA-adenine methylase